MKVRRVLVVSSECQAWSPGSRDQYQGLSGPSTSTATINTHERERLDQLSTSLPLAPGSTLVWLTAFTCLTSPDF